jgi:NTE family protein
MSASGKKVSLVLGSGGARGLAHIGVINWLQENGFEISSISGASMGALIGGIHAAGKLDVYSDWVCELRKHDVLRYLDLSFGGRGLFKGEKIIEVLRDMVGEYRIEDLSIAYTAVATDIDREREIWLNQGPLFDAIRASIAVPTVFTPHLYHGRRLVDGGLLNPLPIAPTLKDLTDLTVAVNVHARSQHRAAPPVEADDDDDDDGGPGRIAAWIEDLQKSIGRKTDDGLGFFDIVLKSLDAMQNTVVRFKLAAYTPDVLIDVPRNTCMAYEFYRARELIDLGREKAEQALGDYR